MLGKRYVMFKHSFNVFVLFVFIALTSLVGCGSILEEARSASDAEEYCNNPEDIPPLKEAVLQASELQDGNCSYMASYDKEAQTHLNWIQCIDRIGGSSAVSALGEIMLKAKEFCYRYKALELLDKRSGSDVVSLLAQALTSKDVPSESAAEALVERNAVHVLIPALTDKRNYIRDDAQWFLKDKLSYAPVAKAMCQALNSENTDIRYEITKILTTKAVDHPCVIPALSKVVSDERLETRKLAVEFFVDENKKDPSVVTPLCEAVMDENQDIRMLAVEALTSHYYSDYHNEEAPIFPALIGYLAEHSASDSFSDEAVEYLGRFKVAAALPALKNIIQNNKGGFHAAFRAMGNIDLQQMLEFAEQVLKENVVVRKRMAAELYLGLGKLPQVEVLIKYLMEDGDLDVRRGAIGSLSTIAERLQNQKNEVLTSLPFTGFDFPDISPEEELKIREVVIPTLHKIVQKEQNFILRREATVSISKFRDPSAASTLERIALDDKDPNRSTAIDWLRSESVTPALRKAAKDPNPDFRCAAARALDFVDSQEAADIQVGLLTKDPDSNVRTCVSGNIQHNRDTAFFISTLAAAMPGSDTKTRMAILSAIYWASRNPYTHAISVLEERLKVETTPSVRKNIEMRLNRLRYGLRDGLRDGY